MKPFPILLAFTLASALLIGCGGGGGNGSAKDPTDGSTNGTESSTTGLQFTYYSMANPEMDIRISQELKLSDSLSFPPKPVYAQISHFNDPAGGGHTAYALWPNAEYGQLVRLRFDFNSDAGGGKYEPGGINLAEMSGYQARIYMEFLKGTSYESISGSLRITKAEKNAFAAVLKDVRFTRGKTSFVLDGTVDLK